METAQAASPIHGDKLYQRRARQAFPLLVRYALSGKPRTYTDTANTLGMPNARNLNYVLGSIGQTIQQLATEWDETIPPIQCLVVNSQTGLPGEGISWFLGNDVQYESLSRASKRVIVNGVHEDIFSYGRWLEVLEAVGLERLVVTPVSLIDSAGNSGRGGESQEHQRLKTYVAQHPEAVELPSKLAPGSIEFRLASADCVDVRFADETNIYAVEVKAAAASASEILRGMFQCVKYEAVLTAMQRIGGRTGNVIVVLALEGDLPEELVGARQVLGVRIVDGVTIPSGQLSMNE